MGVSGDRNRLSMKIIGNVHRGTHAIIIASSHHDAVMRISYVLTADGQLGDASLP
jgi:hypothetical protein